MGFRAVVQNAEGDFFDDRHAKAIGIEDELFGAAKAFAERVDFSAVAVNVRDTEITGKVIEFAGVANEAFFGDAVQAAGVA